MLKSFAVKATLATKAKAVAATMIAGRRYMSVRPQPPNANQPPIPRKKVTLNTLNTLYKNKTPISMVTAYDYPTALAASSSILTDLTLVGDSLAQVCLGYPSTNELTLDEVIHHARAVARGTTHPFTIADMPFGSYHISVEQAVTNAIRLVKEGRVESVKLEGGAEVAPIVRKLVEVGIPVMSHIGLQPQKHISLSGYKVQGKTVESARKLIEDALTLQDAGAYSTLVEAVPKELGAYVTEKLRIPTIGIGAGPGTSGQVCDVLPSLISPYSSFILGSRYRRPAGKLVRPQS
jgi:3-methyl-2-oxobutanoate hydroxymethyltransferase